MSCTDAGATLNGPAILDYTVNGRPLRRPERLAPAGLSAGAGIAEGAQAAVRPALDGLAATEEVAGGAAWLVDPLDTGDLERGLHRLATDSNVRLRLAREGRARVREFSWTSCARLTLAGLRELAPAKR